MMTIKALILAAVLGIGAGAVPPAAQKTEGLSAPAVVTTRAADLWRTLDSAAWVAERDERVKSNGKILYAVSFRSCPTCAAFKAAEHDALLKAGVEIRWILYARRDREGKVRSKPGERATIAQLWLTRDAELMNRWWQAEDLDAFYVSASVPPAVEGDPAREGALARSRAFVDTLSGLLADNGLDVAIPTLIWREGQTTKVYIGYTAEGFAPARTFLVAPLS